jgi:hypothetical protein
MMINHAGVRRSAAFSVEGPLTHEAEVGQVVATGCPVGSSDSPGALLSRAVLVLKRFAEYDRLRLRTYQERGPRGQRIGIASIGTATALRFDDVGYFNRVYAPDESVADRLAEVEAFYAGSPFGCELIGPALGVGAAQRVAHACERRGWAPGGRYAWLAGRSGELSGPEEPSGFELRPPEVSERERFLLTYLRGFEAAPDRFNAAVQNMRHLFERPELHFLFALERGRPAGIGMLYWTGSTAVLCAGSVLPADRHHGCHRALLAARIRLAVERGYEEVVSWATLGGRSQANMEHAGLRTVGITWAWKLPPDRCRCLPHR